MKYSHVFLDFDETLFNHYEFLSWVDDFLTTHHQVTAGTFKAKIDDYHTPMGEQMRLYRHADHMKDSTQREWSFLSAELEKAQRERAKDFCYPEVHATLLQIVKGEHDVRILTYGDGAYQRFKLNTCHLLHDLRLPVHVVDEPKRLFLEREFRTGQGVLVDDKHPLSLPSNWTHIWLDRKGSAAMPAANTLRITNFAEVPHLLM